MMQEEYHWSWITRSGLNASSADHNIRFPYWSFTKSVIAVCALKLSENGSLNLDAFLQGQKYTLRQLLQHTAGVADYGQLSDYHHDVAANLPPWSRDKMLDAVLANDPLFLPGEGWSYSNVGYMLARERIEEVAGKSFAELVAEFITTPLGLKSVEVATTQLQFSTLHWPAAASYHPGWVYHGCLIGTAHDAASILDALFNKKIFRNNHATGSTLQQMLEHYPLGGALAGRPWTKCGYALGLMSGEVGGGQRAIGHSGGGPFCVNAVYHFPDCADPVTVSCFAKGTDQGSAELFATRLALQLNGKKAQ
ncbi:serine hydrolase domain-containing protein [Rouxiella sp. WC2420]|uniref:Serine hydrolase domain-containing protein n=1 Tax=Rouxiella sp. WC2420 TaxID=3234145 RepID=A0AB39VV63_9GAMM